MEQQRDWRRMFWGMALISMGIVLMAVQIGAVPDWFEGYQWWGGVVVFLGLAMMISAKRAENVGNGVMFVFLGLWFVIVSNRLFGFSWYNSWPLALVAVGAGHVAQAIAAHWLPDEPSRKKPARADGSGEESHA